MNHMDNIQTAGLHPLSNVYCSYQHQPGHMDSGVHFFHLFPEELHETLLIFIGPSKAWAENAAIFGCSSSYERMAILGHQKLIYNPNCTRN